MNKKENLNVVEFIDLVKEYPVLYDRSLTQNHEEKNMAWKVKITIKTIFKFSFTFYFKEVAEKIDIDDISYLKSKWRNLRDTFQKSIKNKRDLEEIGMLHKYKTYKHETQLDFLYEHVLVELSLRNIRKKRKRSRSFNTSPFEK